MHELGIANSILEATRSELALHVSARPLRINVRVRELAAVDPDSLQFCFKALTRDTELADLELKIEVCPRKHRCLACGEEFVVVDYDFRCSRLAKKEQSLSAEISLSWPPWRWKSMNQVPLEKKVLKENDRIAAELRERFLAHGALCLNLISSPGSGKTSLLERTLESVQSAMRIAVLTGDIQTENDADRLRRFGVPVKQITTGGTCHLNAQMIECHLAGWDLESIDLLLIENVGNLVCPSSYDLGEAAKIVLLSVTEGEDKPLKYPSIFFKAELAIITKIDLLPYVPFNIAQTEENARRVHPGIEILRVSSTSGEGIRQWIEWCKKRKAQYHPVHTHSLV